VIADSRAVLVQPRVLFFEDVPDLAALLAGIGPHIIRRPDGAWRAMRAAGVADLSRAARPRIVTFSNRHDATWLTARLLDRQAHLARVTSATDASGWHDIATRLSTVECIGGDNLEIVWELDAFNHHFASNPYATDALWAADEQTLYLNGDEACASWEEIGRELARALLPDAEPGPLALPLGAVLGAATTEDAERVLNNAGYPPLAPEIAAELQTETVDDLAAVDTEDYESPYWDEEEFRDEEDAPEAAEEFEATATPEEEEEEEEQDTSAGGDRATTPDGPSTPEAEDRPGHIDGDGGGVEAPGDIATGRSRRDGRRRGRLRSYVVEGETTDGSPETPEEGEDDRVDRAGVDAVLEYEEAAGRVPREKEHHFPGYDIESEFPDGEIARYIEVKATDGPWDPFGVALSSKQFSMAQQLEEEYWLYVVEYARDDERRRIWTIQDPARRVTDFMFDDGWRDAATADAQTQVARDD
jgi:hypothetical protein